MEDSPEVRVVARGRPSPSWVEIAVIARDELAQLKHGHRERGFEAIAARFGVAAQTVRRALAALDFADQEQANMGVDLRKVPLAAVESLRRWHQHDVQAARDAAHRVIEGATIAWVAESERRARLERGFRLAASSSTKRDFGEAVCDYFMTVFPEYTKIYLRDNKIRNKHGNSLPYADLYLSRDGRIVGAVELIEAGIYDAERKIIQKIMNALALSAIFPESFLACEKIIDYQFCLHWSEKNKVSDKIKILNILSK